MVGYTNGTMCKLKCTLNSNSNNNSTETKQTNIYVHKTNENNESTKI